MENKRTVHLHTGSDEVRGSIPLGSIKENPWESRVFLFYYKMLCSDEVKGGDEISNELL